MSAPIRVAALGAQGPFSPAYRIRTRVPANRLLDHEVELIHLPLLDASADARFRTGGTGAKAATLLRAHRALGVRLSELPRDVGVALVQRQVDMLPSLRLERLACEQRRLVLDIDDAVWLDTSRDAGGHRFAFLKATRRKLSWLAPRAAHVIAGNERIAEWFSAMTSSISVIPSLVDPHAIQPRAHKRSARVLLGWIGSPSTGEHLHGLAQTLQHVATHGRAAGLQFELLVAGARAPAVAGMDVRELRWSEAAERAMLAEIDVGLMPLPDNEWTRSKCAYKALLYMGAGIPVVADPVGVSAAVIGHEVGGLLPTTREGWRDALLALGQDDRLRQRLGTAGRERVEREFSVRRWAPDLARILRG